MPLKLRPTGLGSGIDKAKPPGTTPEALAVRREAEEDWSR